MPTVRKLTSDEVQTIENRGKGPRQIVEEQYDQFLEEYVVGDYGEAFVDENEKRLTVRNRFKAAASRRGLALYFIRTGGNTIRFKVVDGNGQPKSPRRAAEPKPVASDTSPTNRRGPGRPRKAAT